MLIGLGIVGILILWGLSLAYAQGGFRNRRTYRLRGVPTPQSQDFIPTVIGLSDSLLAQGEITGFWIGADEIFPARLRAIKEATRNIRFETYIMTPGDRADAFAQALIQKAKEGVLVQMVLDHYGTHSLPRQYWHQLRAAGVEVQFFNRFSWRSPFDYLQRSHRKLLLIDQDKALIGGAGVSDLWDGDSDTDDNPWLDFEVQIEGKVLSLLYGLFTQHWLDSGGTVDLSDQPIVSLSHPITQNTLMVTTGDDPSFRSSPIRALLQVWIMAAQQRIWIASPYWLPNQNTRRLLIQAKQRGVDVRILKTSKKTDKPPVYHVSQMLYGDLLKAGIRVYEYQPSMTHAKVILIDQAWASFGSANVDPRSLFQNDELNLATSDTVFLQKIDRFFHKGFSQSHCVEYAAWRHRDWQSKLIGQLGLLAYWQL